MKTKQNSETGFHLVAQTGVEFTLLLPQHTIILDGKSLPPGPVVIWALNRHGWFNVISFQILQILEARSCEYGWCAASPTKEVGSSLL